MLETFEAEMKVMQDAALVAREAATHEESKAEDKYDTRGLEASYLAGAQAKRAAELQMLIHSYESLEIPEFPKTAAIVSLALVELIVKLVVELESNSKKKMLFIVPKGGGTTFEVEAKSIQVLTPDSRLGSELMGHRMGDVFEIEIAGRVSEYKILDIS